MFSHTSPTIPSTALRSYCLGTSQKAASPASSRRVEQRPEQDPIADPLPNLAAFLDDGEIALGILEPVGSVAVASDGSNSIAMLRRRNNKTLTELLARLDHAIGLDLSEDIFTDEINTRTRP